MAPGPASPDRADMVSTHAPRHHDIMTRRISLALTLAVLSPACGDDEGGTTRTTASSDSTTGEPSTSASTSTAEPTTAGATEGPPADGSSTDGTGSSPTTGDTGGGIAENCEAASAFEGEVNLNACTCSVEQGEYPDVEYCLTAIGEDEKVVQQRACVCEVVAADPGAAAAVACNRDRWENFLACLTPLMCSDGSARQDCFDAWLNADCVELSKQTSGQISLQCLGSTPYMCGSGETIPDYWTCDGTNDCTDGSDENDC